METLLEELKNESSVHMDEVHGVRGLKQIWKRVVASKREDWIKDEIFERHSKHFIDRCFLGWIKH